MTGSVTPDRGEAGAEGSGGARARVKRIRRRAVYEVKTMVASHPSLALPIARRRHGFTVVRDTEVVIEGFPRSGNTFAYAAFVMAQPKPVRAAGRVHAPAQLIAAARWGIPALALVRHPDDAVPSFLIRHPAISVHQAIRGWLRFYAPLLRYLNRLVVGRFDDVTTDFGAVIRRLNDRFGTDFAEFEHTQENVARCWEAIDRDYQDRTGGGNEFDRTVARPSEGRERLRAAAAQLYNAPELTPARVKLHGVWDRFTSIRG